VVRTSAGESCEAVPATDALGHLLALHVTPAHADDRSAATILAEAVQDATAQNATLVQVD
jgi:hypothetical protein